MNIVFVCTGNTCRSPMAEGFAKHYLIPKQDSNSVTSRGLMVASGSVVSPNSVLAMKEYGIDISSHIPTALCQNDIADADIVLTMTSSHCNFIKTAFPQYSDIIFSLSEYVNTNDISDPYGQDLDVYMSCAAEIQEAVINLIKKLNHE